MLEYLRTQCPITAEARDDQTLTSAYGGLLLVKNGQNLLITTALLGDRKTHQFRLYGNKILEFGPDLHTEKKIARNSIGAEMMMIGLIVPSGIEIKPWITKATRPEDFHFGMTARSNFGCGEIDRINTTAAIEPENRQGRLLVSGLIRVRLEANADAPFAGSVWTDKKGESALGMAIAQTEKHAYLAPAYLLEKVGRFPDDVPLIMRHPRNPSNTRSFEAYMEEAYTEMEAQTNA